MSKIIKPATGSKDFEKSFLVNATSSETMKKIAQVNLWWAKNFKGKATRLHDEFSVNFGETWVNFKISELIPGKSVTWLVTDCNLHWIKDKKEWKDTQVVFLLTENEGKTKINFLHKGLTPEVECYENCKPGWTHHLKNGLQNLINDGKGYPE